MTTYKGNTIGLGYNADTAKWEFQNIAQDFIDLNAFSTPDPVFPTAPTTPTTPTEPEQDPCPPGYIYDETLKQCVPDPNYQNPFAQQEQQNNTTEAEKQQAVKIAGTNRTTMDGNFIATDEEYANMSAQELIENLKQRGFVNKNKETGQLEVDLNRGSMVAGFLDSQLARFGQEENTQLNKKKNIIGLLVNKGIIDTTVAYPRGGMSATGDGSDIPNKVVIPTTEASSVKGSTNTEFTPGFGQLTYAGFSPDIVAKFTNYINNGIAGGQGLQIKNTTKTSAGNRLDAENRKKEADALAAEIKAEKEAVDLARKQQQQQQEQEQQQSNERDRVRDEYKERGTVTYNTKDTGGYVTTPNTSQNKPPSERSGYTGSSNKPTPRTGPNLKTR